MGNAVDLGEEADFGCCGGVHQNAHAGSIDCGRKIENYCSVEDGFDPMHFSALAFEQAEGALDMRMESLEVMRLRLSKIAESEEETDLQAGRAYAAVLRRVLDVLAGSWKAYKPHGQATVDDMGDLSSLMVVVAPESQLQEMIVTPQVMVLTQEPEATSVHDCRFEQLLTKLCKKNDSGASCRRETMAKHIAVGHLSGELVATAASFAQRPLKSSGLMGMASRSNGNFAKLDDGQGLPMSPVDVALTLVQGVVFAAFERGGVAVLPAADVGRGRAWWLELPSSLGNGELIKAT